MYLYSRCIFIANQLHVFQRPAVKAHLYSGGVDEVFPVSTLEGAEKKATLLKLLQLL